MLIPKTVPKISTVNWLDIKSHCQQELPYLESEGFTDHLSTIFSCSSYKVTHFSIENIRFLVLSISEKVKK